LAQDVVWKYAFGGNSSEQFNSAVAVSDGVVAVGFVDGDNPASGDWTGHTFHDSYDGIIVKFDLNGNVKWKTIFGGDGWDRFYAVAALSDGYVAVGTRFGNEANGDWTGIPLKGTTDAIIVKFDLNGNVKWKYSFGGKKLDEFHSVAVVSDGIIAVGQSYCESIDGTGDWSGVTPKGGLWDATIVKFDFAGNVVWKKCFGGIKSEYFKSVVAVSDGFVVFGDMNDGSFGTGDWVDFTSKNRDIVVKFNHSGNVVWKKNENAYPDCSNGSILAVADGFILAGEVGSGGRISKAGITKINLNGEPVWNKSFGGNNQEDGCSSNFTSVAAVSDGIVAVGIADNESFGTGDWTGISGKGRNDAIIVKYDNAGNLKDKRGFGGAGSDYFRSVVAVPNGVIAVGNSDKNSFNNGDWSGYQGKGNDDAIVVKFTGSGTQPNDCDPVTNLAVSYTSNCEAQLTWNAPAGSSGVVYNIYRDGDLIKGGHPQTSFTDGTLNENLAHTWVVKTLCSTGEAAPVSVSKPACSDCKSVTGLVVTYTSDCKAQLSWNAGGGTTYKYKVYRDGGLIKDNYSETSFTDSGFDETLPHTWGVQTICPYGVTIGTYVEKSPCKETGNCGKVTNMAVNYTGNCEAQITWQTPTASKAVIFSEGFEGSIDGWTVETNAGGDPWAIWMNSPEYEWAHSGTKFAGNMYTEDEARDAWLYSPAIQLTAGKKYTIKFWLQMPGYTFYDEHDYFELKIGQANASTAMTKTIYTNTTTYLPNWTLITNEFIPTAGGSYYLGFHAFTPYNEGNYIIVDDIEVSEAGGNEPSLPCNIYRDGIKIASNITQSSYTDKNFDTSAGHTWTVKVACAGGGESAATYIAKVACQGVGIAPTTLNNQILVYPNPTTGELTIDNGQLTINNVELYDVMGKKQLSIINCQLSIEKIDLTVFPAGVYFLKITTENGIVTKKVIKN